MPVESGRRSVRTLLRRTMGGDRVSVDWAAMNDSLISAMEDCDPIYRPTSFWGPGVRKLAADLRAHGFESFKSWPGASTWFYPIYGMGFSNATISKTYEVAKTLIPSLTEGRLAGALNGSWEARRDFHAMCLSWDQSRWPCDLTGYGEAMVGKPPQRYRLTGDKDIGWGKPYLNYMLCLAALSHHVDGPPTSFLEIGGGFGVLGEIVMSRDENARYVNLDIPPLLPVAAYYLTMLFGSERVVTSFDVPEEGPVELSRSACLPNWRVADVNGPFDVFVNSYSFQEMEPDVVDHYVGAVADAQVRYAVSLNSIEGKRKAEKGKEGGAVDPVTSARIIKMFEKRGYSLLSTYRDPLIVSAGEIAILGR